MVCILSQINCDSGPGREAQNCDKRACSLPVCMSVCLSVCLSVREHISETTRPKFTEFSVHVACGFHQISYSGLLVCLNAETLELRRLKLDSWF